MERERGGPGPAPRGRGEWPGIPPAGLVRPPEGGISQTPPKEKVGAPGPGSRPDGATPLGEGPPGDLMGLVFPGERESLPSSRGAKQAPRGWGVISFFRFEAPPRSKKTKDQTPASRAPSPPRGPPLYG